MERSKAACVYRADDGRWYLQVFRADGTSWKQEVFTEKGAVMSAAINNEQLVRARALAQSVLEGVQRLETTTPHVSYDQETVDGYLGGIVTDLATADSSIWGAIDDFKEKML